MSSVNKKSGAVLSTAAAALLACAPMTASAQDNNETVEGQCWGLNACKGLSHCKGAANACKGQNSCKGEGFLIMPMRDCMEVGGDFSEANFTPPEKQ